MVIHYAFARHNQHSSGKKNATPPGELVKKTLLLSMEILVVS